jgi:hypothetical protein
MRTNKEAKMAEEADEVQDDDSSAHDFDDEIIDSLFNNEEEEVEVDHELVQELNAMSLKEREEVLYDIHGVGDTVEETPELLTQCLKEMDAWMTKKKRNKKQSAAYRAAESQSREYVEQRKLRLMFLRADNFDAKWAAHRLMYHFEKKLELFGMDKLAKDITLDDMSASDVECIGNGHVQHLPVRDQAGRAVIAVLLPHMKYQEQLNAVRSNFCSVTGSSPSKRRVSPNTFSFFYFNIFCFVPQTRTQYYLLMSACEDEETQKKGCVLVGYGPERLHGNKYVRPSLEIRNMMLFSALPIRPVALHLCLNSVQKHYMFPLLVKAMGRRMRVRIRFHKGTFFLLMTIGDRASSLTSLF